MPLPNAQKLMPYSTRRCPPHPPTPTSRTQAYEEFDEEVQDAEELEEQALRGSATQADRDDEIKPYIHK